MDGYKKKPIVIAAKTLAAQLHDKSVGIVETLAKMYPSAAPSLWFTYFSLGAVIAYHQEELNDFTKHLMDHQEELGIDFDSEEFKKGFLIQLETYFKLRIEDKKLVAKEIFSSFCGSPNKPNFPLERYNDTLTKISVEGLQYLVFVQKEIYPLRDVAIERKYESGNYPPPPIGKPKEWWIEQLKKTDPISNYISQWTRDVYPATVDVTHVEAAIEEYRQEEVQQKSNDLSDLFLEMEQLGIMRTYNLDAMIGGGGSGYVFTPYGLNFINFIPKTA